MTGSGSLVSAEWLQNQLGAPDLRIVDATVFLPGYGRNAGQEHREAHIPGAVFMDLDEVADRDHTAPHMLPPEHIFANHVRKLGIGDADRIVFYDNSPLHSAARAWWMFRTYGARRIAVLDGGMQKWRSEGRPVESGAAKPLSGHYTPLPREGAVADLYYVSGIVHSAEHEIVDARPVSRFAGEEPEPRPGVEPGHIPGSRSLPQSELFNRDNSWKQGDELRAAFHRAGVDLAKPMVTTCGSGITAAVLLFGAHLLGQDDVKLYDGSWSEWGADLATPKETGRT